MHQTRLSRRALVLFVVAFGLTTAELSWWVVFNVRAASAQRNARLAQVATQQALAESILQVSDAVPQRDDIEAVRAWLAHHFADLEVTPCCKPGSTKAVCLRPRATLLAQLEARQAAHLRMFIGEGAFFVAMVCAGGALIVRAMRHQVGAVRQQANFLAAVTHELKSPLATIRLYVETLERRAVDAQTLREYLGILHAQSDRLEGLVNNVLLASRLEAPCGRNRRPQLALPVIALESVIEADLPQWRQEAQQRGMQVQWKWTSASGSLGARIDIHDWRAIVRNLIDNAIKYGAAQGAIEVDLNADSGHVYLRVTDGGVGLLADEFERIFDKFYRVGDEMVRQFEGSGLGLFLVRALSESAGGSARAHSPGLGLGATFTVVLPQVEILVPDEQLSLKT